MALRPRRWSFRSTARIEFHVTSLDVIHDFWAIELGVKADAVQGADNVAFVKPLETGSFQVRCAELCGLWHGHMNTTGDVVSASALHVLDREPGAQVRRPHEAPAAVLARLLPTTDRNAADMESASLS